MHPRYLLKHNYFPLGYEDPFWRPNELDEVTQLTFIENWESGEEGSSHKQQTKKNECITKTLQSDRSTVHPKENNKIWTWGAFSFMWSSFALWTF